jgi:hypothetical protein
MTKAQPALKQIRMVHAVFLITQVLLILVILQVHPSEGGVAKELLFALPLVSASNVLILGGIRSRQLAAAREILRTAPDDDAALSRWRAGNILGFVCAESVSLFGLVLKFLGAQWNIAGLFFAVGISLLLIWTPRLDLPSQPD